MKDKDQGGVDRGIAIPPWSEAEPMQAVTEF